VTGLKSKLLTSLVLAAWLSTPLPLLAEETGPAAKEPVKPRMSTSRETEILGTVEKPQFSTDLPWKPPQVHPYSATQPRRSFNKEIFRPISPGRSENRK
jgi:hypothetical protein